jgi:predicted regulator of Ras-like GTPase activity (Roadblock/LC7/MglB family)
MNFEDELRAILSNVAGAQAVVLMGFDGIPVAEAKTDEPPFPLGDVLIEYSRLLSDAIKISEGNNVGGLSEFMVSCGEYKILLRVLNANYFAALVIRADGNLGKGRYLLKQHSPELSAAL